MEKVRAKGGIVTREPGTTPGGGTTIFAFVKDPDGYSVELFNLAPSSEPLRQLSLHMINMDRAIEFYQKVISNTNIIVILVFLLKIKLINEKKLVLFFFCCCTKYIYIYMQALGMKLLLPKTDLPEQKVKFT